MPFFPATTCSLWFHVPDVVVFSRRVSYQGHLHTYRFCDNVWTFILTDAVFQTEGDVQMVDKVKIVAADHKLLATSKDL